MTIDARLERCVHAESSRRRGLLTGGIRAMLPIAREVPGVVVRQHDRSAPNARHLLAERFLATRAPRAALLVGQRSVIRDVTLGTGDVSHVSQSQHDGRCVQPRTASSGKARSDGVLRHAESQHDPRKEREP
jgi:hypothetical protein